MSGRIDTSHYRGLEEHLDYNPSSGDFYWKSPRKGRLHLPKKQAGGVCRTNGYRLIGYKGKRLKAHRCAWYLVYGEIPEHLDHINGDRADNRLSNLRPCTHRENLANCRLSSNNTSGVTGVRRSPTKGKWIAKIMVDRRAIHLGTFSSIDEAKQAREQAERKYFGRFRPTVGAQKSC